MLPLLTIDLDALAANYHTLRRLAGPAAVAGVVKANAYGLGVRRVVKRLTREGCGTLFVAHLSEAAKIRKFNRDIELFVLNGFGGESQLTVMRAQNITPIINSAAELAAHDGGPAALHIDSGMSRLGLDATDLAAYRSQRPPIDNMLLMTHLASSDDDDLRQNSQQVAAFMGWTQEFAPDRASLNNSAGTLIASNPRCDLVRPGIALYGAPPRQTDAVFNQVITLEAPILQIRQIAVGTPVGYGASWTAQRPSRIATLPVGYADGFLRSQSNKPGNVAIDGVRCPIVGRISMDLTTVDVTDLPTPPVAGQAVELIGPTITLDEVAARAGTIPYEVLTSLGRRYARTYKG